MMSAQRVRRTSQSTTSTPAQSGGLLSPGVLLLLIPLTKDLPVVQVVLRAVHEVLQILEAVDLQEMNLGCK